MPGKLLRDSGLEVVVAEPPEGHPLRRRSTALVVDGPVKEGLLFAHLTEGQEFVELPTGPLGTADAAALVRGPPGEPRRTFGCRDLAVRPAGSVAGPSGDRAGPLKWVPPGQPGRQLRRGHRSRGSRSLAARNAWRLTAPARRAAR
jgi:hypothetical protein